jgi:hypothetical protein
MRELIADAVSEPRFNAFLIGAFALLAMAMAAAGMYSVIACLVSQRTSEIAIRMALGASRRDIVRTILGTTTAWVAAGLAVAWPGPRHAEHRSNAFKHVDRRIAVDLRRCRRVFHRRDVGCCVSPVRRAAGWIRPWHSAANSLELPVS